jgi:transposase InsO family protein
MVTILFAVVSIFAFRFRSRAALELKVVALQHQLAVLRRQRPGRPQLSSLDRLLWVLLYRIWPKVIDAMVLVKPATVVEWHRKGFRFYWRWQSRGPGRPRISADIRDLIRRMSRANPLWGAPRIHGELLKLGIKISQATVGRWMPWRPKVPSPTWRSFLRNHLPNIAAIDMFVVATATFQLLYALIVLSLDRRRVVHFAVTPNPTQDWLSRQMTEAFPWDTAPRYVLRDRDKSYGPAFRNRVRAMGITEVITAPRSPWQNPYAERLIGSIRRECLDHVIIFNERHLRRVLSSYFQYHHDIRTHLSLGKDCPRPRPIQSPSAGNIIAFPEVGGLHHRYERRAA